MDIKGFTLLEILITIILASIGVLGILNLQLKTLANNRYTHELSTAVDLANNFVSRICANSFIKVPNNYFIEAMELPTCTTCMPEEQAAKHRYLLQEEVKNQLPQGKIDVVHRGEQGLLIITWRNSFTDNISNKYEIEFGC